jgi:DNA-binding NarL/FixJ family response regulator
VADIVLSEYLTSRNAPSLVPLGNNVTPREREIIQLLAEGKSNKEIAVALNLSTRTVEAHRANIMHKLNLDSLSGLVRYAIRNHIVEL